MDKFFDINYYKFGFGHYWYGNNKRLIGVYCSIPFFLLLCIFYIFLSNGSLFGVLLIVLADILVVPLTLVYLFFKLTFSFKMHFMDDLIINNLITIIIFLIINRFMINFFSEKFYNIDITSKDGFHNSPKFKWYGNYIDKFIYVYGLVT